MTKICIRSAIAAFALLTSATVQASADDWAQAQDHYDASRYAAALAAYERLGASGDARAAELAGHMHMMGERLYGAAVPGDPVRAVRLLRQAARAGSPTAQHLLRGAAHLAGNDGAPVTQALNQAGEAAR